MLSNGKISWDTENISSFPNCPNCEKPLITRADGAANQDRTGDLVLTKSRGCVLSNPFQSLLVLNSTAISGHSCYAVLSSTIQSRPVWKA